MSYNTQKEKWTLNELISHYVQEEERRKREKTESAHLATNSHNKRKRSAGNSSQNKKAKEQPAGMKCFFCKKYGHMKNDCSKFAAWKVKKGKLLTVVCHCRVACGAVRQVMLKDSSMWAMATRLQLRL